MRRSPSEFVIFAILSLVVAACGGDSAETTGTETATTTSLAPVTTGTSPTTTTVGVTATSTIATTTTEPVTSTTGTAVSLEEFENRIHQEWPGTVPSEMWETPDSWACEQITSDPTLGKGSVAKCVPATIGEGEYPVLTVLVLDDAGTIAVSQAGLPYDVLNADRIVDQLGAGLFCRDILGDSYLTSSVHDTDLQYFGAVLYWFMEGRPDRMDADRNEIPCETLVASDDVDSVWGGGWVEG